MIKTTAISELLVKDHVKIVRLVHDLEESLGKSKVEVKQKFDKFVWELEKHIFTEEKVLFNQYKPDDVSEVARIISVLFNEHDKILAQVKDIKKAIRKERIFNFQGFKEMLMSHKDYEDEKVYPKFDRWLDEDTKKEIVSRINEIL